MLAKERQSKIEKMLQQDGAVTTSNLVELFDVSVETIRRDFPSGWFLYVTVFLKAFSQMR